VRCSACQNSTLVVIPDDVRMFKCAADHWLLAPSQEDEEMSNGTATGAVAAAVTLVLPASVAAALHITPGVVIARNASAVGYLEDVVSDAFVNADNTSTTLTTKCVLEMYLCRRCPCSSSRESLVV
jgi:hypothetical protein